MGMRWDVRGRGGCSALAGIGAAALALAPATARADGELRGLVIIAYVALAADVSVGVAGVTTALGTGITLNDEPPPVAWRTASWGIGALNVVSTTIMLGIAGSTEDAVPWVPIGVAHLALTAANFAVAGVATARADEQAGTTSAPLESVPATVVPLFRYGGTF